MTTKTAAGGGLLHDWQTPETLYPVLDDLEALEFYGDDDQGHLRRLSTLWRSQPSLVQVRARAQFHAAELRRLTEIANADEQRRSENLATACALSLLVDAGNAATFLISPISADDEQARLSFARAFRRSADRSGKPQEQHFAERILGGAFVVMSEQGRSRRDPAASVARFIAQSRADHGAEALLANASCNQPGFYPIEGARSLQLWFETGVDLADLFDGARALFHIVNVAERMRGADHELQIIDAIKGARLLAYARICRIGLRPAQDADDLAVKQATSKLMTTRMRDGDRNLAIAQWAMGLGEAMSRALPKD